MEYNSYQLQEVCSFIDYRGKTPPKTTEGIPLITAKIIKNGTILPPQEFIATDYYDEWMRRGIPKKGSVVFTTEAPLGEVAQIKTDERIAFAQRVIILEPNPNILDENYLLYALQDQVLKERIKARATGTTVIGIKAAELKKVIIDLPPLDVQKNISDILRSFDDKIELNQKINTNLCTQARALTAQWLIENDGYYEFLPLSEVASINPDSYSPKHGWEYVNYLDTSSITEGAITEIQRIFPAKEKLPSRARRIIAANDIVFSTVRPNQRHFGLVNNPLPHMLASTGFAVIRSNHPNVCNEIIYLRLTENAFIEKMQQLAEQSTSTFPSIKPSDLGNCEIPCPTNSKCTNLSTHLNALFSLISANQSENSTLAALRDTLLPKLIAGEIDVSTL